MAKNDGVSALRFRTYRVAALRWQALDVVWLDEEPKLSTKKVENDGEE